MSSERVFVIGDIHGCLDMFNRLMEKIPWRPDTDRLIFLGDYIDRGENPKGVEIEKQSLHDMVWIRDHFLHSTYDFGKRVIFGHTPFEEPLVMENKIGLDTGAVQGNRLTCLELPEVRFYSAEA